MSVGGKSVSTRRYEEIMILLISSSAKAADCAAALEQGTRKPTQVADSLPRAITKLQACEYEAIVIDQSLLEMDFSALDRLLNHAGIAMPVYVNLALHRADRIVRQVQEGLRRAAAEKKIAMHAAESALRGKLRDEVTGILLNSELALRQPAVPALVAEKIRSVQQLAEQMRSRLAV
jgi:CheY-like chemotaxis protein